MNDLGGEANISTQERALVEEAVKPKLILDSVDAWILSQKSLIHKKNKAVLQAVKDRATMVNILRGLLNDLGLKRRAKEAPSLGEYLEQYETNSHLDDSRVAEAMKTPKRKGLTILEAMTDLALFGPWFQPEASWMAWKAFLAALFGRPLPKPGWSSATSRGCSTACPC